MNKQLAQELLIETVLFYNSGNRSFICDEKRDSICLYENEDGKRCAFGRILTDEAIEKIKEKGFNKGASSTVLLMQFGEEILMEKWRPIGNDVEGRDFFVELQFLHDNANYWDELGITEEGMEMVKYMTAVLKLDFEKIKEAIEKGRKKG